MKRIFLAGLSGLLAFAFQAWAQSTTSNFAPANFGNFILTSTPSNATGNSGVSTVFTTSGQQLTFGTGGALVNPMEFNYVVTGPNTATVSVPASDGNQATTTNLVFTSPTAGTYTMVQGTSTATGRFSLADIPLSAPIANISSRSTVGANMPTTVGFVIAGTMPRRVLIRAVGPGLAAFGVTDALSNPRFTLFRGQTALATNSDWGTFTGLPANPVVTGGTTSDGTTSALGTMANGVFTGSLLTGEDFDVQLATAQDFAQVGAFSLQAGSKDAALVATLPPGAYTVIAASDTTSSIAITGSTSGGTTSGISSASTSSSGTSSASTSSTSSTSMGTISGGTTSGTSSSSTPSTSTSSTSSTSFTSSTGSTSTGSTSGTSSSSSSSTSTGTTSGGTTSGTSSLSTSSDSSLGGTSSTSSSVTSSTGEVLVEVYFVQ